MEKKYNTRQTSIQFDREVKPWLFRKMQEENRTLSNVVNTILKREKEREESSLSDRMDKAAEGLPLVNY